MLYVPYESSGQELGETRVAMGKRLMQDIEACINAHKDKEHFYIMVHAKPWPDNPNVIKVKIIPSAIKPSMQLSCMLFEVDNKSGKLLLNWALPGNWPTWSVEGTNEPIPEVVGSLNELSKTWDLDKVLAY